MNDGQPNAWVKRKINDQFFFKKKPNLKSHPFLTFDNIGFSRNNSDEFVNAWKITPNDLNSKARVYFLHATGNDCIFPQLSLFESLCRSGIEVITFDLDGHGLGSNTKFHTESILENTSNDLFHLNLNNSLPNFIIGQSLGGAIGMYYLAKTNSIPVHGAVFVSVPDQVNLRNLNPAKELWGFTRPSFISQWKYYGMFGSIPAAGNFRRKDFPIRLPETFIQSEYKTLIPQFINGLNLSELCKFINQPILLIYGNLDTLSTVEHGEKFHKNLKHSTIKTENQESHFTTLLTKNSETIINQWILKILTTF